MQNLIIKNFKFIKEFSLSGFLLGELGNYKLGEFYDNA